MWKTVQSVEQIVRIFNSNIDTDGPEWDTLVQRWEERRQKQTNILVGLYQEPATENLQAYLQRLKRGPDEKDDRGAPIWNEDTFIEGIKRFAELLGSKRSDYYDSPIKGLHYPHTFLEQWARSYPQFPTPLWLDDLQWQSPPGWLSEIIEPHKHWIVCYTGTEPLSQALNKLIKGPTTLDCGMCSALVLWFGIRYALGDDFFDRVFPFRGLTFVLTQKWQLPLSKDSTRGNWLHDFYDFYTDEASDTTPETQASLQVRTVYNHPLYLVKHPAGTGRLQNILQLGAECIVFNPLGPSIMSLEELDHSLLKAYNDEQTPADIEQLELFKTRPDFVDDRRGSKSWGDLAKEGVAHANHMLSNSEWDESLVERTKLARNLRSIFNIKRLMGCVTSVIDEGFGDITEEKVFCLATMKRREGC